jgi:hypothetical protein
LVLKSQRFHSNIEVKVIRKRVLFEGSNIRGKIIDSVKFFTVFTPPSVSLHFKMKNTMKKSVLPIPYYLLGLSFCLLLGACGKNKLREYYFPLEALHKEAKVYEYEYRIRDSTFKMYWYYQSLLQNDSIYLIGTCYNQNFEQLMVIREERVKNGMKLTDMYFYTTDAKGYAVQNQVEIQGGAVFPFEVKDSNSVFINIIKYKNVKDSTQQTTLTRNRRFLKETNFDFKGQKLEAVAFEMKEEQAENDTKRGGIAYVSKIQELYAKNIGLVYTKRQMTDSEFMESRLLDIYTMSALEEKFKKNLSK